jgi:hypothetical protein
MFIQELVALMTNKKQDIHSLERVILFFTFFKIRNIAVVLKKQVAAKSKDLVS